MKIINVILAVLVSLALAVGVFEGGLRLTQFAPTESANMFDPELGWSKRPGAVLERSSSEFDVTIEINQLGLRDDPMESAAKPADTFRVVCLGDSFTMGYTMDRDELFVDLLESWWLAEGRPIEIINAGTEGYSTDQEARWLELHGEDFAPDLVLLFPYENDIFWNGQNSYVRFPKPRYQAHGKLEQRELVDPGPRPWTENLATTRALGALATAIKGKQVGEIWFQPEGAPEPILREFAPLLKTEPDFMAECRARTRGSLLAIQRKCEELGAGLVMVPIPARAAVDAQYRERFNETNLGLAPEAWSANQPVDQFLGLAKELGIASLDPRSAFKAAIQSGAGLYFRVDWHLNPSGNRALAHFLHDELDNPQAALLPAELAPKTQVYEPPYPAGDGMPFWVPLYAVLLLVLGTAYKLTYRDEPVTGVYPKVALMLGLVFTIFLAGRWLANNLPPEYAGLMVAGGALLILGFLLFKLGRRVGTVLELIQAFVARGHWYLLPLVVVLLSIGSLLVVAASSPFVAPFIYTLF